MTLPPFDQLLQDHAADLHGYLRAGVGPDDADDCFQEVMLAALRAYPDLRDATNLRGWLFTIAYRKAIDRHRGEEKRRTVVQAVTTDGRTRAQIVGGSVAVAPAETEPLWEAVQSLPPKQRAAVLHRYLHDLTYRDIGQIVGCSEAAARQNVRAGLAALRETTKGMEP